MIAAGEVIEGPFSVVKELMENSIDAGSTRIEVEIADSGMKKIVVRDNGSGMSREDVSLSIREHATSKIEDIDSLSHIRTYGFRGEALSSIASVSDLTIFTRASGEDIGSRLNSRSGDVTVTDFAGASGTTVIVENLFFNFPARKKFLKSRKVEQRFIREIFLKMALVSYEVAFSLDIDGSRIVTFSPCNDRFERLTQIYGKAVSDNLYYDSLTDLKVTISGYLSKPGFVKASRNMQLFYINGRPVDYKYMSFHLSRAYEAVIPRGKYPAAVIFLDIDTSLIDVNIHPAKREVKVFDQPYIDSLVYSLAEKVLNRSHSVPLSVFDFPANDTVPGYDGKKLADSGSISSAPVLPVRDVVYSRRESMPEIVSDSAPSYLFERGVITAASGDAQVKTETDEKPLVIVGVVFDTYVLVQEGDLLHMIDFHAAHERMLYDSIIADDYDSDVQNLIFPHTMTLAPEEFRVLFENIDEFERFGFAIDEFPDYTVVVRSVPVITAKDNIDDLLNDILNRIVHESSGGEINEKFAASLACHSAKRAGDSLSRADMESLVAEVMSMKYDLRCPHGRPYLYTLKKYDLERMFKR